MNITGLLFWGPRSFTKCNNLETCVLHCGHGRECFYLHTSVQVNCVYSVTFVNFCAPRSISDTKCRNGSVVFVKCFEWRHQNGPTQSFVELSSFDFANDRDNLWSPLRVSVIKVCLQRLSAWIIPFPFLRVCQCGEERKFGFVDSRLYGHTTGSAYYHIWQVDCRNITCIVLRTLFCITALRCLLLNQTNRNGFLA